MRLKITLDAGRSPTLPLSYNHAIQALLYGLMEPKLAGFLHGGGYENGGFRNFKMFTFSKLLGDAKVRPGFVTFRGPFHFYLASALPKLLGGVARSLIGGPGEVRLCNTRCRVRDVAVVPEPEHRDPAALRALSPICVYSTVRTLDGRKKWYPWTPWEPEFSEMLVNNLARKAEALGWQTDPDADLEGAGFRPLRVSNRDLKIVRFKGTAVKGWAGLYEARLPEPYFRLALDTGLGAKNPGGFGMVEAVRD